MKKIRLSLAAVLLIGCLFIISCGGSGSGDAAGNSGSSTPTSSTPATDPGTSTPPASATETTRPYGEGTAKQFAIDAGRFYVPVIRKAETTWTLYVRSIDIATGNYVEKEITSRDGNILRSHGIACKDGMLYIVYTVVDAAKSVGPDNGQSEGAQYVVKVDASTLDKASPEKNLFADANLRAVSDVAVDEAANTFYMSYENVTSEVQHLVMFDQNGDISVSTSRLNDQERFNKVTVGSDYVLWSGTKTQLSARDRIYAVSFPKDLSTRNWSVMYRNFLDTEDADILEGVAINPVTGNIFLGGTLNTGAASGIVTSGDVGKSVVIEINPSTGAIVNGFERTDLLHSHRNLLFATDQRMFSMQTRGEKKLFHLNLNGSAAWETGSIGAEFALLNSDEKKLYVLCGGLIRVVNSTTGALE